MNATHLFELMIAMLFAVIALHYVAHRLRLPPAVALIAGGAALAFMPDLPQISWIRRWSSSFSCLRS